MDLFVVNPPSIRPRNAASVDVFMSSPEASAAWQAEHESRKRASLRSYYQDKAARVGLSFDTYCKRFSIKGMV